MDLPIFDFTGYPCREAFVVENRIVYFGDNCENKTFVLKKGEKSENIRVVREEKGFNLQRGSSNAASRVIKSEIYAFKTYNYEEVHRYSLERGKWSRFYPSY